MKTIKILLLAVCLLSSTALDAIQPGLYVVATDFAKADGKTDVADKIQKMIDTHPNRTIFFPDGVYMISHSIVTPADPAKAVHLVFANFAVIKAADNWQGGALVRLGGKDPYNTTRINGSNYGIEGGIFDGSGIADGITIESGRETRINHVSIKHVFTGIHILFGANSGSSDSDIVDCNIIGNDSPGSTGILVEGYDNTFSNIRLNGFTTGVHLKSGGNSLKNIHPLSGVPYDDSCGFRIEGSNNWLDYCYADHFATCFYLAKGVVCNFTYCWVWWWNHKVPVERGIVCEGPLESYFYGLRTGFGKNHPNATLLKAEKGGRGYIEASPVPEDMNWTLDDVSNYYIRR